MYAATRRIYDTHITMFNCKSKYNYINIVLRAYVNLKPTNSNLCDYRKILMYYDFIADELDVIPPIRSVFTNHFIL